MTKVKNGDTVKVHYTGTLDNGSVFDSSRNEGREPFSFQVGSQQVIPGFETGIMEMSIGDKKTIVIESEDAYGPYDERLVRNVPVSMLPEGVKAGSQLQMMSPGGPISAVVTGFTDDKQHAVIDHNHQLAGQRLTFELELLEIA